MPAKKTHTVYINRDALELASAEFFMHYGNAMAQWARVERGFFWWFAGLTGLKGAMARSLYYGVRTFVSRLELLESAVEISDKPKDFEREFIAEAIKKARQFVGFRNAIAHGEPIPHLTDDPNDVSYHIVKPKTLDHQEREPPITLDDLEKAAMNFVILGRAILRMHPRNRVKFSTTPQEYLAQVRGLPNAANIQNDLTVGGSAPFDEEPALRNKRAFRAAAMAAKAARGDKT